MIALGVGFSQLENLKQSMFNRRRRACSDQTPLQQNALQSSTATFPSALRG